MNDSTEIMHLICSTTMPYQQKTICILGFHGVVPDYLLCLLSAVVVLKMLNSLYINFRFLDLECFRNCQSLDVINIPIWPRKESEH